MNIPECLQYITNVVSLKCSKMNETNYYYRANDYGKWKKIHISHRKRNSKSSIILCFLGALMIFYIFSTYLLLLFCH